MKQTTKQGVGVVAGVHGRNSNELGIAREHTFEIVCRKPDGSIRFAATFKNLVVDEGLNHNLDVYYGATAKPSWYIGLIDGSPTIAAGDTMSSHAGWTEVTTYDETTRQAATFGTASGGSINNAGSVASFSINATVTIGGMLLTTDNTKGGTAGILNGAGAFNEGDRSAFAGDTLDVTVTATNTAA